MDYAYHTVCSRHLQQDKSLTSGALAYHDHHHDFRQNSSYPSSCQLPRYDRGFTKNSGHEDAWTRFLQSHSTSEHPQGHMVTTQSTPCGFLPKPSGQLIVTCSNLAFVQEPPLPLTCLSTESIVHSQLNGSIEASVFTEPRNLPRRMTERSYSISSSASSSSSSDLSWSSWAASSGTDYETEGELEANVMVRRNKTLPPPILAPPCSQDCIAASTTSSWASSSPSDRSISPSRESARFWADDNCHWNRIHADENDPLSGNWPKIERITRCQQCYPQQNGECPENETSGLCTCAASCQQPFVLSKLPPPPSSQSPPQQGQQQSPSMHEYHDDGSTSRRKFLALSASIWGPGWHQVEPLPPSFVRTMQQNELEAQEKALALAQEKAAQATANPRTRAKKAKQRAKAAAAAAATAAIANTSATTNTNIADINSGLDAMAAAPNTSSPVSDLLSSARLPRSLQFVD
ncbi:MAG: hypothetical protein J3Q66DRAFT_360471 [Benniella sp.]|nr:MAG: hypothetical protein J3Q66DRAFT_360471 [Benniella sp.]